MPEILQLVLTVLGAAGVVAFVLYTIVRADESLRMAFKWGITVVVLGIMYWKVAPLVGAGGYAGAFAGIPATAICGLLMAIVWRRNIAELIAQPFGSLYDGGATPPDPKPLYATAQALQKKGRYLEAIDAANAQLARFPEDMEGHVLIAEIQAQDLQDLTSAENTIEAFCSQPGHHPRNIAYTLFAMADWYLAVGKDRAGAERCLRRVIERLPETEHSLGAAQRLAHMASPDMFNRGEKTFAVPAGDQRLGLKSRGPREDFTRPPGQAVTPSAARSATPDGYTTAPSLDAPLPDVAPPPAGAPDTAAAEYIVHLEQHPLDWEARENLAAIYVNSFERLDLANEQMEFLISQPNAANRNIVRWLNMLADLQVRAGADYEAVRATLERIIQRNPDFAAAEQARGRLSLLKLEFRAREKTQAVKLATYEQNIGLKSARQPR